MTKPCLQNHARRRVIKPPRALVTGVEVGKVYMFWDQELYKAQGGHDVGDNSQCWAEAVVLVCPDEYTRRYSTAKLRREYREWEVTATVRFLHSGRISSGMFINDITSTQSTNQRG